MSYKVGAEAVIRRFRKRFPDSEFDWSGYTPIEIHKDKTYVGAVQYMIRRMADHKEIVKINIRTDFGINLSIDSVYLLPGEQVAIIRRPKNPWIKGNQHRKRAWLKDKPKFAEMGAKVAAKIFHRMGA